ncbi:OLC1v1008161C1 [Oldenlandia corymbosa var. corymbosa]|uniref:Protein FAR1-RELATED SEQUENCE n=1 Tax=Oldenlandia corymbosa var. corymbosa TaxID=529605 RepID=A0AAV1DNR5_OLDCO|nr:OLC1v1008161C1 [Oldenlandia corymbosa var. corymbosa]
MLKETSESGNDSSSQDDIGTIEEMPEDSILSRQTSTNLVPFIGQRFVSQDAAYEFYSSFATQYGFSIRRHRTRGKDGVGRGVTRRDFTCHRGGYAQIKPSKDGKVQRNRKSSRCGCQAHMRIVKRIDFDVPEWRIIGFSNVHNHELLKTHDLQLLPSHCTISADDKTRICMFSKAGMSVRQMLRLMELEKGVKVGYLPFSEIDLRNMLLSIRNVGHDHDPLDLLKLCKEKKDKDPNFKYDFKLDANNQLENIAWSYASSVQLYDAFGDALVFDTTHRLDAYDMLLGIFIGVDNHGINCFFGCVLLRDENVQSFSWALKTFLGFMNGKAPGTILTDQNMWLKEAVAVEMPRSKHAFCIWHIISKFSEWFSGLLASQYDNWKTEFIRLYNLYSVEEFEAGWRQMIETFGLEGNSHIVSLYALRMFWATSFLRSYFFAGMTSTCYSESINSFIRRFLSAQSAVDDLVEQVAAAVDAKDVAGAKLHRKVQRFPLKTGSPIESHVATVLTPYAFGKLQEELILAPQYASLMVDENYFIVRHHIEIDGGCKVLWAPCDEFISCSCRNFEFTGILCRHILRVLSAGNCFRVPDQYLPHRWSDISLIPSKTHPSSSSDDYSGKLQMFQSVISKLIAESVETQERLDVACDQVGLALARIQGFPGGSSDGNEILYDSPSDSFIIPEVEDSDCIAQRFTANEPLTKLKDKISSEGPDVCRKRRRSFSCCGQFDHDASDCPIMGDDGLGFI